MSRYDLKAEKGASQYRGVRVVKAQGTELADALRLGGRCI